MAPAFFQYSTEQEVQQHYKATLQISQPTYRVLAPVARCAPSWIAPPSPSKAHLYYNKGLERNLQIHPLCHGIHFCF